MADLQGYIVLFLIFLVSIVAIKTILTKTRNASCLPPSPLALPIIGHLHLLGSIPHQGLHKLSTRYGPLVRIFLGSVPCLVASSPDMAKELLKTHEASFSARPHTIAVDYLTYGGADFAFANYGPYWKFMKKICMTELLGGPTLDQFRPVKQEEIRRFLSLMLENAKASDAIDVGRELNRLINNVISRMTMGQACCNGDNEAEEVRKLVQGLTKLIGKFNLSDYIWLCKNLDLQRFKRELKEVHDRFDAIIERIMKEHEEARKIKKTTDAGSEVKDFLNILLNISEDRSSEIKLTRENIKAFILDIFAAGTDTSPITIEWALAELINHPNIMEKARAEIDNVVGRSRLVEEADIVNLPYLQAVVKESLRLHPTGPLIVRESTEECTINGYQIPAGTRLFVNVWAIGRDPNHWEMPLEFSPERFVISEEREKGKAVDVRGQHFQMLPFGSGRRRCPGTSLALQLVHTTLAAMIQCFEWRVNGGNGTVNMEEGQGITLPRANPLICVPVVRLNPLPLY